MKRYVIYLTEGERAMLMRAGGLLDCSIDAQEYEATTAEYRCLDRARSKLTAAQLKSVSSPAPSKYPAGT